MTGCDDDPMTGPALTTDAEAAEWWLAAARRAARVIDDAPMPDTVAVTAGEQVRMARRSRKHGTALQVPKSMLAALSGTSQGEWLAAHAVAASRWPVRGQGVPMSALMLGLGAFLVAGAASAGRVPPLVAWIAAPVLVVLAVVIAVATRRAQVTALQTSDRQATRVAGLDAARTVLGGREDELYKTAAHQWWRDRNPMRAANRLARLEAHPPRGGRS